MTSASEGEGRERVDAPPDPFVTREPPVRAFISIGAAADRKSLAEHLGAIDGAWRRGSTMVVLAAPGLMERADFGALVAHVVSRGLALGLVTDGLRLKDPALLDRMVAQGNLRYVHLRSPAGSAKSLISALRTQGVFTVLTRDVGEEVESFESGAESSWPDRLALLWGTRGAGEGVPEPTEAGLRARAALLDVPFGLSTAVLGLPACGWPSDLHDAFVSGENPILAEAGVVGAGSVEDNERLLPPACAGCVHDRTCMGVAVSWLEGMGEGALTAARPESLEARQPREAGELNWGDGFRPTERPRVDVSPRYPDTALATLIVPGCDLSCVFCDTPQLGMPIRFSTPDLVRACLRALKPRTTGVFFTGGEPTQLSWLQGLLSEARDLGFQRIQMQSHAGRAADAGYAEALVQAGLTAIDVPIYGHTPELHQVVTRTPGSFQRTLAGLENLRSLGVHSVIHVTLFRSNLAHLEQILRFIDEVGPNEAYLQVTGETGPPGFFADAAPGPGEVARACLEAFEAYSPTTRIRLSDVVPCLVPALEDRVIRWQGEVELKAPAVVLPYSEWLKVFSAGGTRSYGEDCGGCSIRDRCDGLPREILQLHGERELSPI